MIPRIKVPFKSGVKFFSSLVLILVGVSGCAQFLESLKKDGSESTSGIARRGAADPIEAMDAGDPMDPDGLKIGADPDDEGVQRPDAMRMRSGAPTQGGTWNERGYLKESSSSRPPSGSSGGPRLGSSSNEENSVDSAPAISYLTTSNYEPPSKHLYRNGSRATKDDFIDQSQEEGSLWASSGQTNYYFTKNKIRSPGDLISLVLDPNVYRDIGIEVKRTLTQREKAKEVGLVQEEFHAKFFSAVEATHKDVLALSSASAQRSPVQPSASPSPAPSSGPDSTSGALPSSPPQSTLSTLSPEQLQSLEMSVPRATLDDVDIYPSLDLKAGDVMMGEIVERLPNGNLKIRTVKRIPYKKGQPKLVSVIGIVKGTDLSEDSDVINASKLYDYRIEVSH